MRTKREKCIYDPEENCESSKSEECEFFCAIAHGIWKPKKDEILVDAKQTEEAETQAQYWKAYEKARGERKTYEEAVAQAKKEAEG